MKTKDINIIYKALNEAFTYISDEEYCEMSQSALLDNIELSCDIIEKLNINL